MTRLGLAAGLSATLIVAGCFSFPVNPPLGRFDTTAGYRYTTIARADPPNTNPDETFVILTFSGGGTRAAALSYGVLDHLRQVPVADGRTLLDEVDVISSVSGGSFTAAYYGLFGQEAFFRGFKDAVLYRKIERDLILRILAPWNWPWLLSPHYGRSDLATDYYDRQIFQRRRYADMPLRRPFIMLNATDISRGAQFSFIQDDFDRLCSDLSGVAVARGVTASSAFPVAFTPLTLKNYPKSLCGYHTAEPRGPLTWVDEGMKDFEHVPSRYGRAATWRSYEDAARRPFIHLSDGGLADNIGLRGPEVAITSNDSPWSLLNSTKLKAMRRIIVIVVDAKPEDESALDQGAKPPGIYSVLNASATNPMENYSSDTVELLRNQFREWDNAAKDFECRDRRTAKRCAALAADLCSGSPLRRACETKRRQQCSAQFRESERDRPPHPLLYRIHVRFAALKDPELRKRLQEIPTQLQLPREDIQLLIDGAATLLDESDEYRCLVSDLASNATTKCGQPIDCGDEE